MNCELTEQALIDESLPRPDDFDAHLSSCESCRALASAHREALRLRGATLSRSHRRPLAEVKRRAGIVGGLMLALGGGFGLVALELSDRPEPAARDVIVEIRPEQEPMRVAAPQPEGDLFALAALQAFVASDSARDPREDATAERVFGQLPRWTAPRRTQPMRSLGRAASPVVFTSEDSP